MEQAGKDEVFEQGARELKKTTYEKVRIVATSAELDLALLKIDVASDFYLCHLTTHFSP